MFSDRVKGSIVLTGNSAAVGMQAECARITLGIYTQTVACKTSEPVRYLTVKHQTMAFLQLCEVVVQGYEYKGKLFPLYDVCTFSHISTSFKGLKCTQEFFL